MHGKAAEVGASALSVLLRIELEAVAVEEWPRGKTRVGGNSLHADATQCGRDAAVEVSGHTNDGQSGMSEKKVEVAVVCIGSENPQ